MRPTHRKLPPPPVPRPSLPVDGPRLGRGPRGLHALRFAWYLVGFFCGVTALHFLQTPAPPAVPEVFAGPAHVIPSACNGVRTRFVLSTGESAELVYSEGEGRWVLVSSAAW